MGHYETGAAKGLYGIFHDFPGGNIQMVRRFVQNKEIRFFKEEAEKGEPCLLPAGKHAHRLEHVISPKKEHTQDIAGFLFPEVKGVPHFVKHRELRVESFLLLGIVSHFHIVSHLDESGVRFLFSCNHFQDGGLPCAVGTDEADGLPFFDMDGEIFEKHMISIGAFHPKHIKHLVRTFLGRVEMEAERCLVHRLFQPHQPVQLGLAPPCLLGLNACLVTADVFFRFPDMLLLLFIGLLIGPVLVFLSFHVPGIAAAEGADVMVFQINNSCSRAIQEIAVMGNHENTALVGAEVFFQPFQHVHVQMVRRFVQKEEIGVPHKSSSQINPHLLPAGKEMDIPVPVIIGKTQSRQDFPGGGFIVVAAKEFKARFRPAVILHQFLVALMAFQLPGQTFHLILVIEHILPGLFHFLPDAAAGVVEILPKVADNGAVTGLHGAFVRLLRAHDAL